MAKAQRPEITTLTGAQLEQLLAELRPHLPAATYQLIEGLLRTLQWIMAAFEQKTISIARLRRMLFGHSTETTAKMFPPKPGTDAGSDPAPDGPKAKRKGHGRNGSQDYPGAQRVKIAHPTLKVGQLCPQCGRAKLYLLKIPARIIRMVAQPLFQATVYELERLRCALCGAVFTAPAPPEAGTSKYDPSVGTMLALMRYGAGQPMYRMDQWQTHFGVPLPASTQWELIEAASPTPALVYDALIGVAAQGRLLHHDDTTMRVHSLRHQLTQAQPPPEGQKRTGIFTTSIVSQVGPHPVALFFTGNKHAGENLDQLLQRRAAGLGKPLQMCDGLSRNLSKEFETILCNCLLHGRRMFVDVVESFPEECRFVVESLREVYRFDAMTKEQKLSDTARLAFHQEHSRPVMETLHGWMEKQFEQRKVEPNSGLGQAINYMLKRWEPLARFLEVPRAPLDNNLSERALKMAILHRKNSMAYKTLNGARIGDIFMSLIHTCQLNRVNPFEYLQAVQQHGQEIPKDAGRWLPWNYVEALEPSDTT
jgi:transposase